MNRKYDEAMERVQVTPEMRRRVLTGIQEAGPTETKIVRFPYMKKILALAACFALVLAGALTLPRLLTKTPASAPPGVQVANGIVEAETLEELSELVGFDVAEPPSLPFAVEETVYASYWQELAEIVYRGGGREAVYRMAPGTEDVSGDYNAYAHETEIEVDGLSVTLKGGDAYTLALWNDGRFSFSLSLSEGISESAWRDLLQ